MGRWHWDWAWLSHWAWSPAEGRIKENTGSWGIKDIHLRIVIMKINSDTQEKHLSLNDLPVLQMTSRVLAQPSLLAESDIQVGHDGENWAVMSVLNHSLAISRSPFGCLPSAAWAYMLMCRIYGCGQQNNNKLSHYECSGPIVPNLCPLPWQLNRSGL